ncbi:calcineurin-like phosphoesterase [Vibrio phage 1.081.O._10N.286.52.C2]|nr:calcineurin-like phosphoesterase [Vibrio phage 1.081.O._10N.286.52.C2]
MSCVWFTSDLHLGHRNIGKYRDGVVDTQGNTDWIVNFWKANVKKRDVVIMLGDTAFTEEAIDILATLPGIKRQYGGNHDDLPVASYLRAVDNVRGCEKFRQLGWLSHFPLHPEELRGQFSIHGHVHYSTIPDWRYVNVCCDNLQRNIGQPMITLDNLRKLLEVRRTTQEVSYDY